MNDCDELDNLRNAAKECEMQNKMVFGDIPVGVYVNEHDSDNCKLKKKRNKPPGHVQWNLQENIELDEPKNTSNLAETSKQLKKVRKEEEEEEEKDRLTNAVRSISTFNKEYDDISVQFFGGKNQFDNTPPFLSTH
ncbi:unnamed protein product [Cercopithifilaria johnstoni]|uniref:Uncharacterized protein n=1 Tax=Cercopithifilaria johnstoni TaxID=2874296 RepID=A0A8J2MCI5_9BILA|nr:unnamed protein product [Cercopithifilaria johnstoni]